MEASTSRSFFPGERSIDGLHPAPGILWALNLHLLPADVDAKRLPGLDALWHDDFVLL